MLHEYPDLGLVDTLYDIQGAIIHHGGDKEARSKAIEAFNSMPKVYRKFAFDNYKGNGLCLDENNFIIIYQS